MRIICLSICSVCIWITTSGCGGSDTRTTVGDRPEPPADARGTETQNRDIAPAEPAREAASSRVAGAESSKPQVTPAEPTSEAASSSAPEKAVPIDESPVASRAASTTGPMPRPWALAKEFEWTKGEPEVAMLHRDEGFAFLTGVHGGLEHATEVRVVQNAAGDWMLGGTTNEPELFGHAVAVPWFGEIERQFTFKTWRREQGAPNLTRLVHRHDGFCVLMTVGGSFRGSGEQYRLLLHEDGYWRFNARSQAAGTRARIMIVKMKQSGSFQGIVREHHWRND
jgi:hypothetical protein